MISVFVDFDGTITKFDIGDALFMDFGQFEPWHSLLVEGKLKIRDYWHKLAENLDPGLTKETFAKYAIKHEIDAYFIKFADYCRNSGINISIVSDGFDIYIEPILKHYGLEWIPFSANKLRIADGKYIPEFPGASESCNCLCASCKRNAVLANFASEDVYVFIGDGYSDYCAAEHCDIVFAKRHLAAYCNSNRIPHYTYSSFFDVYRILKKLLETGKFSKRHQAFLKRKKAFEIE